MSQAEIDQIKTKVRAGEEPWASAYAHFIKQADRRMNQRPRSVVENGAPYGAGDGDVHKFGDDRKYVRGQDGVTNRDASREDSFGFYDISHAIRELGFAYALTGEDRYARKVIDLIYHWCVAPDTYMLPRRYNFSPHTKGTPRQGSVPIYESVGRLVEGGVFVRNHPHWNGKRSRSGRGALADFERWLADMYQDAVTDEETQKNNYKPHWVKMTASLAAYLDDEAKLKRAFNEWKKYAASSINSEGRMRLETKRTRGIHYSLVSMQHLAFVARLAMHRGVNLWDYNSHGSGKPDMKRAFDYMVPFITDPNVPERWSKEGFKDITSPPDLNYWASNYELAYSHWQDEDYRSVLKRGKRPLLHMSGHSLTLFHGETFRLRAGGGKEEPEEAKPEKVAPVVRLTSPLNGDAFAAPATVTIEAEASDADGSVDRVEFFVDGVRVGADRSRPFAYAWTDVSAGAYELTARAIDNDGLAKKSGAIQISVAGRAGGGIAQRPSDDVIVAADDAFVRGGDYRKENYGRSGDLFVKRDRFADFTREAFVKFDLGAVQGDVREAVLRLYPRSVGGGEQQHRAELVEEGSWDERTLCWSNRPSGGATLATWMVREGRTVEVDLTAAVQRAVRKGKELSLRVYATERGGGNDWVFYASGEHGNAARRPALAITTTGDAPSQPPSEAPEAGEVIASTVKASRSQAPNVPASTVDGDPSTRWSARGKGQWVRYGLGQLASLSQVGIAWYRGDERRAAFDIEVSRDGSTWKRVFSGHSSGKTDALERYNVAATDVRHVRIVGRGNSQNSWNSITEVVLLGGGGAASTRRVAADVRGAAKAGAEPLAEVPSAYELGQNYPNPFNPSTLIAYRLPEAAEVTLTVYNLTGQQVAVLASGRREAGAHEVHWDGRDAVGLPVASGTYFYRIETDRFRQTRRMLLLK